MRWTGPCRIEVRPAAPLLSAWVWAPALALVAAGAVAEVGDWVGDRIQGWVEPAGVALAGVAVAVAVFAALRAGGRR